MANRIPRLSRAAARAAAQRLALVMLGVAVACGPNGSDAAAVAQAPAATNPTATTTAIDSADIAARIQFLASDEMRGRATPSPGLVRAAEYIAGEFARLKLEPGADTSYLQWYALETDNGTARAPNVVGILRGSDPRLRDTYVVYSAHMDHVGVGLPDASGDSIYNGADDDASGTAAVIEIAEAFAALAERPARSIVFLTVSGEEVGLFGSRAFVETGPIRPADMVANLNIDMIGRNSRDTLVAIGLEYSTLGDLAMQTAVEHAELGLTIVPDPWPAERFFFRSDHYNFASAGVPALFLFSGVHEDYHRPSDEPEKIDAEKTARIARLAFELGLRIANDRRPPSWTERGRAALGR